MPPDYLALAAPLGISRVVVVESSSRPEDNAWALDLAERTPLIAGFLGNLSPVFGTPAFAAELARLALRPAFRGLRLGATEVNKALANETALDELRRVADADLAIDVNGATLARVAMLADRLRTLRIVVDHLGNARIRAPGAVDPTWATNVSTVAGASGNVFMKVSGLPEATGNGTGDAPTDPSHYAAAIDHVRNAFGDDRVLFATNWPVCERAAPLTGIHALASSYIAPRGPGVARRFFSGNAASAYKVAGSNGPGPR
jgi:L-fuconolactonase